MYLDEVCDHRILSNVSVHCAHLTHQGTDFTLVDSKNKIVIEKIL